MEASSSNEFTRIDSQNNDRKWNKNREIGYSASCFAVSYHGTILFIEKYHWFGGVRYESHMSGIEAS